jgi:hypothetical protein
MYDGRFCLIMDKKTKQWYYFWDYPNEIIFVLKKTPPEKPIISGQIKEFILTTEFSYLINFRFGQGTNLKAGLSVKKVWEQSSFSKKISLDQLILLDLYPNWMQELYAT